MKCLLLQKWCKCGVVNVFNKEKALENQGILIFYLKFYIFQVVDEKQAYNKYYLYIGIRLSAKYRGFLKIQGNFKKTIAFLAKVCLSIIYDTYKNKDSEVCEMKPIKEGKVREIYDNGDSLIMVATDRISCFDVILNNVVTKKGTVLTQMSKFWFDLTKDILPNHMISADC